MIATLVQIVAFALAVTFAWAALAKALRPGAWADALASYRLGRAASRASLVSVPAAELAVSGLIVFGAAQAGASLALALLGAFSFAVVRARSLQGDKLPCGCFGRASVRDYRVLLVRNVVLTLMSAVVVLGGENTDLAMSIRAPSSSEVVPAVLVGLGVGLVVWMAVRTRRALAVADGDDG